MRNQEALREVDSMTTFSLELPEDASLVAAEHQAEDSVLL